MKRPWIVILCVLALHHRTFAQVSFADDSLDASEDDGRRLFSLWNSLLFLVGASNECPPIGPPHDKCVARLKAQSQSSSSSSASSASSSSSNAYSEGASAVEENGNETSTAKGIAPGSFPYWMLIVAAVSSLFIVGAVVVGTRKPPRKEHPLAGSVARRMDLFGQFADSALGREKAVEMTSSNGGAVV